MSAETLPDGGPVGVGAFSRTLYERVSVDAKELWHFRDDGAPECPMQRLPCVAPDCPNFSDGWWPYCERHLREIGGYSLVAVDGDATLAYVGGEAVASGETMRLTLPAGFGDPIPVRALGHARSDFPSGESAASRYVTTVGAGTFVDGRCTRGLAFAVPPTDDRDVANVEFSDAADGNFPALVSLRVIRVGDALRRFVAPVARPAGPRIGAAPGRIAARKAIAAPDASTIRFDVVAPIVIALDQVRLQTPDAYTDDWRDGMAAFFEGARDTARDFVRDADERAWRAFDAARMRVARGRCADATEASPLQKWRADLLWDWGPGETPHDALESTQTARGVFDALVGFETDD